MVSVSTTTPALDRVSRRTPPLPRPFLRSGPHRTSGGEGGRGESQSRFNI